MSLKAKLEAVIYAAEEPVTLAQLAALFAHEAFEWKAGQEAARAALAAEQAAETGQAVLIHPAGDAASAPDATEPPHQAAEEADPEEAAPAPPAGSEAAADAEARRAARLRDREVKTILRQLIEELIAFYASDERGVEIREIAGGYRMATKPECHDAVRLFVRSLKPALRLSLPALETLAVIAYKQPVTAPEVNEIRGVDSSGVFGSLLARKLIATAGRKQVIGRPILYKTTREFLLRFGLKDVAELPSMEEFEKMAALELDEPALDEPEPSASSQPLAARHDNPSLEFDESVPDEPTPDGSALDDAASGQPSPDHSLAPNGAQAHPSALEILPTPADSNLETAVMADQPTHAQPEERATPSPSAVHPANPAEPPPAEPNPAEAAPAVPPSTEQAENESTPHG